MQPIDSVQAVNIVGREKKGVPKTEQPKPADEIAQKLRTLRKASRDFESIFLSQLLEPMVKSVNSSSRGQQFGGGVMLDVAAEKMAESIAGKGGVGLGDMLYESLKSRVGSDEQATDTRETAASETDHPFDMLKDPAAITRIPDERDSTTGGFPTKAIR